MTGRALCLALGLGLSGCSVFAGSSTDRSDVMRRILPSTVQLRCEREGGGRRSASGVVVATDEPPIVDDESFDPDFGGDPGQRKLLLRIDRELGHSKRVECDWPNHLQARTRQLSLVSMPRARQTAEAGIAVSTGRQNRSKLFQPCIVMSIESFFLIINED